MRKIFKNLSKLNIFYIILSVGFIAFQVWLDLKLPDYMSKITMLVSTPGSEMGDVLAEGGKMLLCAFFSLLSAVIVAIFAARVGADFSATLRDKLFKRVSEFSMEEIGRFSTASLITRTTNDVTQVQMFIVLGLQVMMKAPILAVWAISKIAGKSWQWSAATAVAVVVLLLIVGTCMILAIPRFKMMQKLTDDINRATRENLTGLSVVRAYNAKDYQQDKFDVANDVLTNTHLFTSRTMSFMMPGISGVMNGISLSVYWIGAVLIDKAALEDKFTLFSDMVVFSAYAVQVVMAFMMLVMIFILLPRAQVAANRILEVLETKPTIKDGIVEEGKSSVTGEIEFKNVCFRYPGAEENVIENISFKAQKGQTVALIGATGCGKSTIINMIPRFYDVTSGEVLVDNINVKDYKQTTLRNKLGYVSQKAILFSGNIKGNVTFGDNGIEVSEDEMIIGVNEAIEVAQSTDFVLGKEDGIESFVSQNGANFSGGQKQRISIARAIYRKPEILIFDDSFSALDYKTDRMLRDALKENYADTTKLIVAQRIGTIRNADLIIVLDQGKIVGSGTHESLMKECEEYRQIAYSQLSKEELE